MESKGQHNKDLPEVNADINDAIQNIIDKRVLLEGKFNLVNEKLDKLKAEADKLLHPKRSSEIEK